MNWVKQHKFWTIAVVLFLYGVLTTAFLGSSPTPVGNFIALYIVIGYPLKWLCGKVKGSSHKVVKEADNARK